MDNFSPDDIYKALLVILAVCGAIITYFFTRKDESNGNP